MSASPRPSGQDDEPQIHISTEEKLVYMANQIADFFASQGHEDKAVAGTADHIKSFWDPTMRRTMARHFETTQGAGLKPVALKAVRMLCEAAPGAIRQELARVGHPSGREPGNDAG